MTAPLLMLIGITLVVGGVWQVRKELRHEPSDDAAETDRRAPRSRQPLAFWLKLGSRALSIPVGIWVIVTAIASIGN